MFKAEYTKNKLHELGMKQVWMADKLGVSSQHLSNVVNGTRKPSMRLVEDMAKIMGVDYRTLWTEYDDVQVTCYEPEIKTFDVEEFRAKMAEQPIIPEGTPTIVLNANSDGMWLDENEAKVLNDLFEGGWLFGLIRSDDFVDNMEWLEKMMCIYAKCKAVAE